MLQYCFSLINYISSCSNPEGMTRSQRRDFRERERQRLRELE